MLQTCTKYIDLTSLLIIPILAQAQVEAVVAAAMRTLLEALVVFLAIAEDGPFGDGIFEDGRKGQDIIMMSLSMKHRTSP